MSLEPYEDDDENLLPVLDWGFDLVDTLLYHAYAIYYWLSDVAPIVIKYQLKQMGRDGVDNLPFLSEEIKEEIKRWLRDYFDL